MKKSIVLSTLNARYSHCAFGLKYLFANLGELRESAVIREFTLNENPRDVVEAILADEPKIVGFGVYIWNTTATEQVVSILKRVAPQVQVVLGGPEVSYESEGQSICQRSDFVFQGEADFLFRDFCRDYLLDQKLPAQKWIKGPLPEVKKIISPYAFYSDEDIKNRVIYVEASRGCPYKCEYCLSSLDKSVRSFDLDSFLADMDQLIQRGARQFKFLDRTFNLSMSTSTRILKFFLERISLGLFLHFEMVPDRLPNELRALIALFPKGSLQFEIGIQTWNPEVAALVSRRQDYQKIAENFDFLTHHTGVHMHADLIAGLPGETLESFARGFDAVSSLGSHEIQVGILKRLKGVPLIRHDVEWQMVYQEHAPYLVLKTKTMSYETLQKLGRFSKFWDLYSNSGHFKKTIDLLRAHRSASGHDSFFWKFWDFCGFLEKRHPRTHSIALINQVESIWLYLTEVMGVDAEQVRMALVEDYAEGAVKRDVPVFLRSMKVEPRRSKSLSSSRREGEPEVRVGEGSPPRRQKRHLEG